MNEIFDATQTRSGINMNGHRRGGKQEDSFRSTTVRVPYADNRSSLTVVIF